MEFLMGCRDCGGRGKGKGTEAKGRLGLVCTCICICICVKGRRTPQNARSSTIQCSPGIPPYAQHQPPIQKASTPSPHRPKIQLPRNLRHLLLIRLRPHLLQLLAHGLLRLLAALPGEILFLLRPRHRSPVVVFERLPRAEALHRIHRQQPADKVNPRVADERHAAAPPG
jgi:hypothetical protein